MRETTAATKKLLVLMLMHGHHNIRYVVDLIHSGSCIDSENTPLNHYLVMMVMMMKRCQPFHHHHHIQPLLLQFQRIHHIQPHHLQHHPTVKEQILKIVGVHK
jgi:hypothetical protein